MQMKAKFGQLCTIMYRMHHNRADYPVGSLVDFVSDSMGRKYQLYLPCTSTFTIFRCSEHTICVLLCRPYFFTLSASNPYKEYLSELQMFTACTGTNFLNLSSCLGFLGRFCFSVPAESIFN